MFQYVSLFLTVDTVWLDLECFTFVVSFGRRDTCNNLVDHTPSLCVGVGLL